MSDLRDAFRALKATPIVTVVAVLSLALGIGANTAIFSILNALLLRALPVHQPQRLVQVMLGETQASWTNPLWEQLRDRDQPIFEGVFAYSAPRFNLASGGEAQFVNGVMASGRFFDVLGVTAMLGRTFTPADDVRGGGPDGPVAVISYGFWQRRFGGAVDAIGKPIALDRVTFTVIGVTPPEFTGTDQGRSYDVAVPLGVEPLIRGAQESAMDQRTWWWLRVLARLKPGETMEHAAAALRGIQPQMRGATRPQNQRPQDWERYLKEPFNVRPAATGPNGLGRQYRQPLLVIMGVVALVLLIACANIANLLLARANARRHELSVRVALGASRWRIARQLLAESSLMSASGAALGLVLAHWGARLLLRELSTEDALIALDVGLDWRILLFTATVATTTALLFGTVPAIRATRVQPSDAIKEQGRSIVGESRFGFGSLMVLLQIALSLVLVVGAGLFMRTFSSLANVRLGFNPDPILTVEVNAKRSSVAQADRPLLYERLRQAALGVAGVKSAVLQSLTPLSHNEWNTLIENPPGLSLPEKDRIVWINAVSPDWFATFGTPILAGRDFTAHDGSGAPQVILVNETFAKKYFGGANPVGGRIRNVAHPGENSPEMHIIGLVRDAVYDSLRDAIPPTMFQAVAQTKPGPGIEIAVRAASGSPALLTRALAEELRGVDGDVTLSFRPFKDTVRAFTIQERVVAMLAAFFGGLALLLAGLGLYGVMSYAVSRRRTEIGIRMALGATPGRVVRLVLRRVALLVAAGVAAGAGMGMLAARLVATMLFGLQPGDPATFTAAAVVLASIGALAGWLPARRASRIDPARVLREG
jgi:predicted permease